MWIVERKDGDQWVPTMMAYHSEQEAVWVAKDYQRTLRCEYRAAKYVRERP